VFAKEARPSAARCRSYAHAARARDVSGAFCHVPRRPVVQRRTPVTTGLARGVHGWAAALKQHRES